MLQSGIYSITCVGSGKHYVGSAVDLERRWQRHVSDLQAHRHHNSKLQRAWDKYGPSAFIFEVKERVGTEDLLAREQFWIDHTDPFYNILRKAGSAVGFRHSEEARKLMSVIAKEKYSSLTAEQKEEKARNHAAKLIGKTAGPETRRKMSESHKGLPPTEKQRAVRATMAACHTPEAEAKRALARSKTYLITFPDGSQKSIVNLSQFCREHGLSQSHLNATAHGKRRSHKGYVAALI